MSERRDSIELLERMQEFAASLPADQRRIFIVMIGMSVHNLLQGPADEVAGFAVVDWSGELLLRSIEEAVGQLENADRDWRSGRNGQTSARD